MSTPAQLSGGDRLVIAVDLDEVLAAFVDALVVFHNTRFGTSLTSADYDSYQFADVWKCSTSEATDRMKQFFDSDEFRSIQPHKDAEPILRNLLERFRFVVVTSRQKALEAQTREWLQQHFEGIFEDVLFANHYAFDGSQPISKEELCKSINAKILIDDQVKYAHGAANDVQTVILFGDYAWNRLEGPIDSLPTNAKRAHDWRQLAGLLALVDPRSGDVQPRDAVVVTLRHGSNYFAESVRRTLENQARVSITAVGAAVSTAAEVVELLQRNAEINVTSYRTGTDAAAPNVDRVVRLTVDVEASPTLRENIRRAANAAPTKRSAASKPTDSGSAPAVVA